MTKKTPGAPQKGQRAAKTKPEAVTPAKKVPNPTGRRRHDWEAIERDYRTGQLSLRELEAKHGAGYSDIGKRAKREGWTQDLRQAVRQATSAALIADIATKAATEAQQSTTTVVLAAAEVNRQVIGRHLEDLNGLRDTASALLLEISVLPQNEDALTKLAEVATEGGDDAAKARVRRALQDALSVHNRVSSIQKLADTFRKVQDGQRRALSLDDPAEKPPKDAPDPSSVSSETAVDAYRAMVHG